MATRRLSTLSSARNTSPIPPPPSLVLMTKRSSLPRTSMALGAMGTPAQGREVLARWSDARRSALDLGAVLDEIMRRASGDSSSLGIPQAVSPGLGTGVRQTIEMPPPGAGDFYVPPAAG